MSTPVAIRHFDLGMPLNGRIEVDGPLHAIFRQGCLPLGARTYASAELPLSEGTLDSLRADLGADQLIARDSISGMLPWAVHDAKIVFPDSDALPPDGLAQVRLSEFAKPGESPAREAVSLVICTRDRLRDLQGCLAAVRALDPAPDEVIVVDNSPNASARAMVAAVGVCFVHEPIPGLSAARNTGIRAASGTIIAFTDDDARPEANWIRELGAAFARSGADAVTGLVLPIELHSEAQQLFEFGFGGLGSGFLPKLFDHRFVAAGRHYGLTVWRIGAGANMAFRREILARVGLFDERLGAGASGCSEDSELWYRILAAGGRCFYEPRCIVGHRHRADLGGLKRQVRAYMRGHVAALVAQADRYGDPGNLRRLFRQLPRYLAGVMGRAIIEGDGRRFGLAIEEAIGWTQGLGYVVRPGWRRRANVPSLREGSGA